MLGSFTEELVNKTIEWYLEQNLAYFRKSYAPYSIINKYTTDACVGQVRDKGDLDYYGVCGGRYVAFEVKETSKSTFVLSQIKSHQLEILMKIRDFGGHSFLMLNFVSHDDSCFMIDAYAIRDWALGGKRRISVEDAEAVGRRIPMLFPGILDFLALLQHSS